MLSGNWLAGLRILILVAMTWQAGPQQEQAPIEPLAVYEKEMEEHPLDALVIARRAGKMFRKDEKRLKALAAQLLEKSLHQLGFGQVMELVEVVDKDLEDSSAANRIRVSWLRERGFGLSALEVRRLLGPPPRVSSQLLYRGQIEQWGYDRPTAVVLIFFCTKGHTPSLQIVHSQG